MANRPCFIIDSSSPYFKEKSIDFKYYSGFAISQKQLSVKSMHEHIRALYPNKQLLEISCASENGLGKSLSAFNLNFKINERICTLESVFQSSKVFDHGGPYTDLLYKPSIVSKKDERIKNSGELVGFEFLGESFPLNPKTFFYDWIYINALNSHKGYHDELMNYSIFTDIAFNPKKSINCQARSAAIFVSLKKANIIDEVLNNKESFKKYIYGDVYGNYSATQLSLF